MLTSINIPLIIEYKAYVLSENIWWCKLESGTFLWCFLTYQFI